MTNDPKDRHVLAAAVVARAHAIVTDNVKDFPLVSVEDYDIEIQDSGTFLLNQYHLNPDRFISILQEQADETGKTLSGLVAILAKRAPDLAKVIKG